MELLNRLSQIFGEFPGIGPRQAKRFTYFLLGRGKSYTDELIKLISELKEQIKSCPVCFRFHSYKNSAGICRICEDKNRDNEILMIVSRDVDLDAVERSHFYNGKYFVLGGNVPILEKEPETKIRIKELLKKIESDLKIKEIILSLNANPEGEHTADYVKSRISKTFADRMIKITVLGRGLSTGTELEYSDTDTIKNALKNRS